MKFQEEQPSKCRCGGAPVVCKSERGYHWFVRCGSCKTIVLNHKSMTRGAAVRVWNWALESEDK